MSVPTNIFTEINALANTIGPDDFFEQRIENDADGNPLYVAWTPIANSLTSASVWFIKKLHYDGNGFVDRVQLPDDGIGFKYAYDDRATIFS